MVTKLSLPFTKVILKLWDYLLANRGELFPFETPAWHTLWLKTFLHYPEELYFLSADDKAIAPFIRNGNTVSFSGGKKISDYMDIVCPDEEIHDVWPKSFHISETMLFRLSPFQTLQKILKHTNFSHHSNPHHQTVSLCKKTIRHQSFPFLILGMNTLPVSIENLAMSSGEK